MKRGGSPAVPDSPVLVESLTRALVNAAIRACSSTFGLRVTSVRGWPVIGDVCEPVLDRIHSLIDASFCRVGGGAMGWDGGAICGGDKQEERFASLLVCETTGIIRRFLRNYNIRGE